MSRYGISTKIALPAVGENLQDQTNSAIIYTSIQNSTGYGPFVAFTDLADLFGNATAELAASTNASIKSWAAAVSNANNNSVSASALEYLFQIQHNLIFKHAVPSAEIITTFSGNLLAGVFWGLLPFSRGNVHINSPDPLLYPQINPNFFLLDFDLAVQVAVAKLARKFWATAPASTLPATETQPGLVTVPEKASDAQWAAWVKRTSESPSAPPTSEGRFLRRSGRI